METTRANNGTGPQVPNPAKFPNGMEPVVAHVHSLGLKMGLYTSASPHTCAGYAASCMFEDIDAMQWAKWQIDYMKDDACGQCRPEGKIADYAAMQVKGGNNNNNNKYKEIEIK